MVRRFFLSLAVMSTVLSGPITRMAAQEAETSIHVDVNMVQLNVAVMDQKGNYVTGLRPSDFVVTEDGIPQKVAIFGEGNEATRTVSRQFGRGQSGRTAQPLA